MSLSLYWPLVDDGNKEVASSPLSSLNGGADTPTRAQRQERGGPQVEPTPRNWILHSAEQEDLNRQTSVHHQNYLDILATHHSYQQTDLSI